MGDNYLKRQAGDFRRKTDAAMEDLKWPTLFQRTDVVEHTFHARPDKDERFACGERLWAMPEPNTGCVMLLRGSHKVGLIDGDGASTILSGLRTHGSAIFPMDVRSVLDLSGVAELALPEN